MANYETLDVHNQKMEENSFEENLKELEEIVLKLDEAINEFHKAMVLVKSCDDKLNDAKDSIAKLVKDNENIIDFNVEE